MYGRKPFENIVGKGENAGHQHFLLCQQLFPPSKTGITISGQFVISSASVFNLDQYEMLSFDTG